MNNSSKVLWITRTAISTALLIILQAATAPLGSSLLTGSIVNLILIVSVMTCGLMSGLNVAVLSPIIAKFFGIGPLWSLIPFIAAGNIALVALWHFWGNKKRESRLYLIFVALPIAAVTKFAVLYLGIARIAIPFFLGLPESQVMVISNMFSISQLITAAIGGAVAITLLPILKKTLNGA